MDTQEYEYYVTPSGDTMLRKVKASDNEEEWWTEGGWGVIKFSIK